MEVLTATGCALLLQHHPQPKGHVLLLGLSMQTKAPNGYTKQDAATGGCWGVHLAATCPINSLTLLCSS